MSVYLCICLQVLNVCKTVRFPVAINFQPSSSNCISFIAVFQMRSIAMYNVKRQPIRMQPLTGVPSLLSKNRLSLHLIQGHGSPLLYLVLSPTDHGSTSFPFLPVTHLDNLFSSIPCMCPNLI